MMDVPNSRTPEFKCTQIPKFKCIIPSIFCRFQFNICINVLLFSTYDTGENISVLSYACLNSGGVPHKRWGPHCYCMHDKFAHQTGNHDFYQGKIVPPLLISSSMPNKLSQLVAMVAKVFNIKLHKII